MNFDSKNFSAGKKRKYTLINLIVFRKNNYVLIITVNRMISRNVMDCIFFVFLVPQTLSKITQIQAGGGQVGFCVPHITTATTYGGFF